MQHMGLCWMLRGGQEGRGVWGRAVTCIYMAESLCKTTITLLISYTPMQNKKVNKNIGLKWLNTCSSHLVVEKVKMVGVS